MWADDSNQSVWSLDGGEPLRRRPKTGDDLHITVILIQLTLQSTAPIPIPILHPRSPLRMTNVLHWGKEAITYAKYDAPVAHDFSQDEYERLMDLSMNNSGEQRKRVIERAPELLWRPVMPDWLRERLDQCGEGVVERSRQLVSKRKHAEPPAPVVQMEVESEDLEAADDGYGTDTAAYEYVQANPPSKKKAVSGRRFKFSDLSKYTPGSGVWEYMTKCVQDIWGMKRVVAPLKFHPRLFEQLSAQLHPKKNLKLDKYAHLREQVKQRVEAQLLRDGRTMTRLLPKHNAAKQRLLLSRYCKHDQNVLKSRHAHDQQEALRLKKVERFDLFQKQLDPTFFPRPDIGQVLRLGKTTLEKQYGFPKAQFTWQARQVFDNTVGTLAESMFLNAATVLQATGKKQLTEVHVDAMGVMIQNAGMFGLRPGLDQEQIQRANKMTALLQGGSVNVDDDGIQG